MNATRGAAAPWDRFAQWSATPARLLLLGFVLLLIASATVPIVGGKKPIKTQSAAEVLIAAKTIERKRDDDLQLYDRAIARIAKGEHYYDFIVGEQRKVGYPVRPGLAVRLPTLAYVDAWIGYTGQVAVSIVLLVAVLLAWWRRLGSEPGARERRLLAMALLSSGAALGLNTYFFVLHELWAGMLVALSFGLHRPPRDGQPGRYLGALFAAALALSIRELVLPYVLLMAVMALWRGDRREGLAWSALALVFVALLAVHLRIVAAQVLPTDPYSPSWLELRGLSGWFSNVVMSSNIRSFPHWLAGPLLVLTLLGWAGWRSAAGAVGTLLYLGYGLAFMIASRADNFYWGFIVTPAMFMGLAFTPMALKSLLRSARPFAKAR